MIGQLPKKIEINGAHRAIRSDFRVALLIFQAYADPELTNEEKTLTMIECLYEDYDQLTQEEINDAVEKAVWFLDGGKEIEEDKNSKKVIDWEQDEQIIFPAINKVAGFETREKEYIHWWTLMGYFNEIGEGLLSNIISIRMKKAKGKKLEKYEQEFYKENKKLIDLDIKISEEEQREKDRLNALLG
ncbi:MAG: Gp15 family bacteriophage protein [Anaerocolumna sp.]